MSLAYGFRRSEALGLRWEDIDFEGNRIVVRHTVVEGIEEDGRRILVACPSQCWTWISGTRAASSRLAQL